MKKKSTILQQKRQNNAEKTKDKTDQRKRQKTKQITEKEIKNVNNIFKMYSILLVAEEIYTKASFRYYFFLLTWQKKF